MTTTNFEGTENDIVYLKQDQDTHTNYYQHNSTSDAGWSQFTFPIKITNNSTSPSSNFTIKFITEFTLTYTDTSLPEDNTITVNSDNITIDGNDNLITLGDISGYTYTGLIQSLTNRNNLVIQNIKLYSINPSALNSYYGWICSYGFTGNNNLITNCGSTGNIISWGGGICGQNSQNLKITKCFNNGDIDIYGGGILGGNCSNCIVEYCYWSLNNPTNLSYSIGSYAGGIIGANAKLCKANNCYSTNHIQGFGGGIYGYNASNCEANNCYSIGQIDISGGGIYADGWKSTSIAKNCYTTGDCVYDIFSKSYYGGIFASSNQDNPEGSSNNYSEGNHGSSSWNNDNAKTYLSGVGTIWLSVSPYFLLAFNKNLYNPNVISNNDNVFESSNGLLTNNIYIIISALSGEPKNISIDSITGQLTFNNTNTTRMRYILQIIAVNQYTGYNINTFTYNYNENIQETILLPTNTNNRNLIIKIIKNITNKNNSVDIVYANLLQKLLNNQKKSASTR